MALDVICDTLYDMSQSDVSERGLELADPARRTVLALGVGGMATLVLTACGDGATAAETQDPVSEFTIVADNLRWDIDRVVIAAGDEVTVTVENRDRGIPHNFHVRSPGDPKTELEDGIVTQMLRFSIDEPGEYVFVCDAHLQMTGTVEVV
ncbi:MAG: cupredoxin domain-containing protein [Acidimicrobiales bacterium]|nr:cupredoxin domain-containing protein [Acidimicrobiales bacterium]